MRDTAIRNLYPKVVSINGEKDAYDKDGKIVKLDEALVTEEVDRLKVISDKEMAKAKINSDYKNAVAELVKGIPNTERETWFKQEQEARAYLADNTVAVPFLSNLATTRGVTLDYLVGKVIEKADAYAVAVGTLTGERQKAENAL